MSPLSLDLPETNMIHTFWHKGILWKKWKLQINDTAKQALQQEFKKIYDKLPNDTTTVKEVVVAATADVMVHKKSGKIRSFFKNILSKKNSNQDSAKKTIKKHAPAHFWHIYIECLDGESGEKILLPAPLIIRKKIDFDRALESLTKRLEIQNTLLNKK